MLYIIYDIVYIIHLREFALPTNVIRKVCAWFGGFELQAVSPLWALPGMPGETAASAKNHSSFREFSGNPPRA